MKIIIALIMGALIVFKFYTIEQIQDLKEEVNIQGTTKTEVGDHVFVLRIPRDVRICLKL